MRLRTMLLVCMALTSACASLAPRSRASGPVVTQGGIRFRYFAPSAHRVQLAGDWPDNNWSRGDGPVGEADIGLMEDDDGDGVWELTVSLATGQYAYLFRVDEGTWHLDPGNPERVDTGPVGQASRLVVIERGGVMEVR